MPQECQKILPDRVADRTPEGIENTMADSGPEDILDRMPERHKNVKKYRWTEWQIEIRKVYKI